MGKGDTRRPGDEKALEENWARTFGPKFPTDVTSPVPTQVKGPIHGDNQRQQHDE